MHQPALGAASSTAERRRFRERDSLSPKACTAHPRKARVPWSLSRVVSGAHEPEGAVV